MTASDLMSGMTGYEAGGVAGGVAAYPGPAPGPVQYSYGDTGDPHRGHQGWAGAGAGVQYPGHTQLQGQGSPSDRYSYYDNR